MIGKKETLPMEAKWFNVNASARVWAGHSESHKMGWMNAGSAILAVEEYKGSYRFEDFKEPSDLSHLGGVYNAYWIRKSDVSLRPFEDEDEDVPPPVIVGKSDAELGAAFRIVGRWIFNILHGISS